MIALPIILKKKNSSEFRRATVKYVEPISAMIGEMTSEWIRRFKKPNAEVEWH